MIETITTSSKPAAASDATAAAADLVRRAAIADIAASVAEISRRKACLASRRLMQEGVSIAHLHVLWLLEERSSMSMGRLAELLGIGLANATGLVDRMEQRGLVARDRDDVDRRVVHVRCTPAGAATMVQVDGWRAEMMTNLLERLDTDQLARVAAAVKEMRSALDASGAPPTGGSAPAATERPNLRPGPA